jgi:hypothetical protein
MAILSTNELLGQEGQPVHKSRFRVIIDGIPSFLAFAVSLPVPTTSQIPINHINIQRKSKGKTTWGDMTLSLRQFIAPSTLQLVWNWFLLGHQRDLGKDGYDDIVKRNIVIQILDPEGAVIQQHSIFGCFIKTQTGLDYSYDEDDKVDIGLDISVDWARLDF